MMSFLPSRILKLYIVLFNNFFLHGINVEFVAYYVGEKGPRTKPDKLRGGLHGGLTNSETKSNHPGWSEHNNS